MSNEKLEAYKKEFIEWGRWVRCDPDRLSYPSPWFEMIMRDNIPCSSVSPNITDDRAMAIDKAVSRLSRYSVLQYQIFVLYFAKNISEYKIAKMADMRVFSNGRIKNARNIIKENLSGAMGYVIAFLENNA
ncbi:hypothetical protein C0159_08175 [Moraxella catarrhalis]|uniref:antiterminator Q family protein n=1 Tax=Moraxella catarrhalis TaxID=480 RepID=UPI00128DECBE|nr:antiterminator Q family protein [Moraxella catarrhalis]MPX26384.1 hypothetical protein [Moraxella catarrhalis]MPX72205.1 hypothetical protein [Moraxella catarrhalis]